MKFDSFRFGLLIGSSYLLVISFTPRSAFSQNEIVLTAEQLKGLIAVSASQVEKIDGDSSYNQAGKDVFYKVLAQSRADFECQHHLCAPGKKCQEAKSQKSTRNDVAEGRIREITEFDGKGGIKTVTISDVKFEKPSPVYLYQEITCWIPNSSPKDISSQVEEANNLAKMDKHEDSCPAPIEDRIKGLEKFKMLDLIKLFDLDRKIMTHYGPNRDVMKLFDLIVRDQQFFQMPFESLMRVHNALMREVPSVLQNREQRLADAKDLVSKGKFQEAIWIYSELGDEKSLHEAEQLRRKLKTIFEGDPIEVDRDGRTVLGGSLTKYLVQFKDGSHIIKGIFKPDVSEEKREEVRKKYDNWEFWYSDSNADEATYLLDLELKTGLVPMTLVREMKGEDGKPRRGSLIYYLSDVQIGSPISVGASNFIRMLIFDFIARGVDRKASNFLYSPKINRISAIDNGGCFDMSGENMPGAQCMGMNPSGSFDQIVGVIKADPVLSENISKVSIEHLKKVMEPFFNSASEKLELARLVDELGKVQAALQKNHE